MRLLNMHSEGLIFFRFGGGKRGRKKRGRGDVENFAKFLISQN
jgi:hypothetical protein